MLHKVAAQITDRLTAYVELKKFMLRWPIIFTRVIDQTFTTDILYSTEVIHATVHVVISILLL